MAPSYELAIDQGTTSTRAVLFDKDGQAGSVFIHFRHFYRLFSTWIQAYDSNDNS